MNDQQLDFAKNFFGYGCNGAKFWVIGPEPGGDAESFDKRVAAWVRLGKKPLVDAPLFHRYIGEQRWFGSDPQLQSTWRRILIPYVMWQQKAEVVTTDMLLRAQATMLGNGNHPYLNKIYLSALSSPSTSRWDYDCCTREEAEELIPGRIKKLKASLAKAKGRIYLCIGTTNVERYQELSGVENWSTESLADDYVLVGDSDVNTWVITKHPSAQKRPEYWQAIGRMLMPKPDKC